MELKENKVYETKDGKYINIKEITYYYRVLGLALDETRKIAQIVTSDVTEYASDSKTNVIRKIFTKYEFLNLVVKEFEEETIKCPVCDKRKEEKELPWYQTEGIEFFKAGVGEWAEDLNYKYNKLIRELHFEEGYEYKLALIDYHGKDVIVRKKV